MPTVLIITGVLMGLGFVALGAIVGQYTLAKDSIYTANALQAAEAGVEQSVDQINQSDTFAGYPGGATLYNNTTQGYGEFVTTIANSPDDSNAKIITSTGYAYHYGQTTNPVATRKIKVTIVGTQATGFSVLTGAGGLILSGSGNIASGVVYSNGPIALSGGTFIGSQNNPLTVYSANDQCPTGAAPGPTYPMVCTDSTQPITWASSTNKIYGTVCATGQTNSANIYPGNGGAGLQTGCTASVEPTPKYDRAGQIAAVTSTLPSTDTSVNGCSTWTNPNGFARSWPGNLEITGNVDISGSCNITVNGDVYITGNLKLEGNSYLRVNSTTRPHILVDGTITVTNSAHVVPDGTIAPDFYTFKSSAACSPACTSLSGTDLKTSQALETVSVGGSTQINGSSFYAMWSKAHVTASGGVGALFGQTILLDGSGSVTFGTQLGTGSKTWTISSYQIIPNGSP